MECPKCGGECDEVRKENVTTWECPDCHPDSWVEYWMDLLFP